VNFVKLISNNGFFKKAKIIAGIIGIMVTLIKYGDVALSGFFSAPLKVLVAFCVLFFITICSPHLGKKSKILKYQNSYKKI